MTSFKKIRDILIPALIIGSTGLASAWTIALCNRPLMPVLVERPVVITASRLAAK
jgi:hypothetical protein